MSITTEADDLLREPAQGDGPVLEALADASPVAPVAGSARVVSAAAKVLQGIDLANAR